MTIGIGINWNAPDSQGDENDDDESELKWEIGESVAISVSRSVPNDIKWTIGNVIPIHKTQSYK